MIELQNITFLNPEYFLLIIFIPIVLYFFYKKQKLGIDISSFSDAKKVFKKNNYKFYLKIFLLLMILLNFILILANPNIVNISEKIKKNGIDIVIVLDISGSMEASDLNPNRLEAAKNVINNFIKKLKTDRVWLVVFAWKPFISIPLTFDYNILDETISRLDIKNIKSNWTAIWDALIMAKTLFKPLKNDNEESYENREKIVILLTDWDANNWVDPKLAWLSLKKEKIKVYTVWIWGEKWWYINYNIRGFQQRQKIAPLNPKDLKYISKETGWEYFKADNNKTFETIFEKLQKLEKSDIETEIKKEFSTKYNIFIYSLIVLLSIFTYLIIWNIETWKNIKT